MIDAHVHIERGPYDLVWINKFVEKAIEMNIDTLYLIEHSNRFIEFSDMYKPIREYNNYQYEWVIRKMHLSLNDYMGLINKVQNTKWPIEIKFGLEVCYFKGFESLVEHIKTSFDWDFITGSIHWIDNWGFDHKPEFWEDKDVNHAYTRYFDIMEDLIKTKLFDHLAHPDSIKCFNHYPDFNLLPTYEKIAKLIKTNDMKIEQSAGLYNNYHHSELGMNEDFIKMLKIHNANIITASDAHRPEDVGRHILQMQEMVKNV